MAAVSAASDFTLTVTGTGFTPASVVRWNGASRPTAFINSTHVSAAILAADVSALADYPVTVRDGANVTAAVLFHVMAQIFDVFLPVAARQPFACPRSKGRLAHNMIRPFIRPDLVRR